MSDTPLKFFVQTADTIYVYWGGRSMRHRLLVLIVTTTALAVGCGTIPICDDKTFHVPPVSQPSKPCSIESVAGRVHPDLLFHVKSFAQDAADRGVPCYYTAVIGIQEKFPVTLNENVVGYCQHYMMIMMKAGFWKTASATDRMMLTYHELGHCALHQEHYDTDADIMNSYLLDGDYGDRHWDKLVNKLFERSKK